MTETGRLSIPERVTAVKRRLTLAAVVEKHVKLAGPSGSPKRRAKCPFHGSNSASLALFDAESGDGGAHCFGCGWHGDVVDFVRDIRGVSFLAALEELEGGIGAEGAGPIHRERSPAPRREPRRELIDPVDMGRAIWRRARADPEAARRYFLGRGVPAGALTDARIAPFRYLGECPCAPWARPEDGVPGAKRWPRDTLVAPALMALVRVPVAKADGTLDFVPTGLHVTYLDPSGGGTMRRRKPWAKPDDEDPWLPKRRMLGPARGGCIVLGDYRHDAALFVGEGNETVLSAIGLAGAQVAGGDSTVGIATLSLDNLQGRPRLWKNGVWPLHAIEPDPERPPFTIPGHRGAVTGLVDSDMAPLRGPICRPTPAVLEAGDPAAPKYRGLPIVERKGAPIVRRAITGAERARICGELVVKGWRAIGVADVRAMRAPLGMDFNDAARERAA